VLLRTTPKFNYYMMGPQSFGPFAFMVNDDERAEAEFKAWLYGEENGNMAFGPRPEGKYILWRQPLTLDLHTKDVAEYARKLHEQKDDELVACEQLPLVYNMRPQVSYDEFRFIGHIKNWHAEATPTALAVEDIFLITAHRADRVVVFGVYGEPCDEHPEPYWSIALNTTVPVYAPHRQGIMADLDALIAVDFQEYSKVLH